jgi:hypothetical protein
VITGAGTAIDDKANVKFQLSHVNVRRPIMLTILSHIVKQWDYVLVLKSHLSRTKEVNK